MVESPAVSVFAAQPAPRVFISHSHKNDEFGLKLLQDLRRALGEVQAVWYDSSGGLDGGDAWWAKIVAEISRRPVFLVILSPDAIASKWVRDELFMAWNQKNSRDGKRIIPVLARTTEIGEDLKTLQVVSFLPPETYESALTKLIGAIKRPFDDKLDSIEQAVDRAAAFGDEASGDADRPTWRTEPEISLDRQAELGALTSLQELQPDSVPLRGVRLTRADIEWLIAQRLTSTGEQQPLDLRGSDLTAVNLSDMPLEGVHLESARLVEAHLERANLRDANLRDSDLSRAHLESAYLGEANLENALLIQTYMEEAWLGQARLDGCDLRGSHLTGASLYAASLRGASLQDARLEGADLSRARLEGVDLRRASFDARTDLTDAIIGGDRRTAPLIEGVTWGGMNLAVVDWSRFRTLGDTTLALQARTPEGKLKNRKTQLDQLSAAFRANRQLAAALRAQGFSIEADRFTFSSLLLQQQLYVASFRVAPAIGLALLGVLAGYGYKPMRAVIVYVVTLLAFALGYYSLQGTQGSLSIQDAIIISVTVFHGRAFFVEIFSPGSLDAALAAIEGVIGLLVEITLTAIFVQRFSSR